MPELTFRPYAEAHRTQQNAQGSGETLQDYCPWKGFEGASLATPSIVDEKRKAQTPAGQSSARRRHRCGASKGESSFRLTGPQLSNESPAPRSLPLLFAFGLSSSCLWSWRRTTAGPLLTNQAQAPGCKDHADSQALCTMSRQRKQTPARETRAISRARWKQKRNALSMR